MEKVVQEEELLEGMNEPREICFYRILKEKVERQIHFH